MLLSQCHHHLSTHLQPLDQHASATTSSPLQFEVFQYLLLSQCHQHLSTHLQLLLHHSSLELSIRSTFLSHSAITISALQCHHHLSTAVSSPSQHGTTTHSSRCYRHPFTKVCSHRLTTALLPHIHHGATITDSPQYCSQNLATILLRQIHYRTAATNSAQYYDRTFTADHSTASAPSPRYCSQTSPQYYCDQPTTVLLLQTHRSTTIAHSPPTTVLPSYIHCSTAVNLTIILLR